MLPFRCGFLPLPRLCYPLLPFLALSRHSVPMPCCPMLPFPCGAVPCAIPSDGFRSHPMLPMRAATFLCRSWPYLAVRCCRSGPGRPGRADALRAVAAPPMRWATLRAIACLSVAANPMPSWPLPATTLLPLPSVPNRYAALRCLPMLPILYATWLSASAACRAANPCHILSGAWLSTAAVPVRCDAVRSCPMLPIRVPRNPDPFVSATYLSASALQPPLYCRSTAAEPPTFHACLCLAASPRHGPPMLALR